MRSCRPIAAWSCTTVGTATGRCARRRATAACSAPTLIVRVLQSRRRGPSSRHPPHASAGLRFHHPPRHRSHVRPHAPSPITRTADYVTAQRLAPASSSAGSPVGHSPISFSSAMRAKFGGVRGRFAVTRSTIHSLSVKCRVRFTRTGCRLPRSDVSYLAAGPERGQTGLTSSIRHTGPPR